jgi:DNA-directed RNA polymerase subunit M/transcription elongation factor TFIIS
MTDIAPKGAFETEWVKCVIRDTSRFRCQKCESKDISFREWESSCGGYSDINYRCDKCGHEWWVESADS